LSTTDSAAPRILFVSPKAKAGGPNRSLCLLIPSLAEGYRCEVLMPEDGHLREMLVDLGVPHRVHRWTDLGNLAAVASLYRLIRRSAVDLVYANETNKLTRPVCVAATLARVPFVSHARSMGWKQGHRALGHLRAAKAVIAVSRACADSVARFVRPGRLHVVYNGVSLPTPPASRDAARAELRRELGLKADTRIVVSVGTVSPRKDQASQLAAMAHLIPDAPDAHLLVLGGNRAHHAAYLQHLRSLLDDPSLAGRVTLLGFRSDVARVLLGADVFLHTAGADPHPRAVLEGMAAALPIIAFATDGVVETVAHDRTGLLVPPGDSGAAAAALLELLRDPELSARMGSAGRMRVEHEFSENRASDNIRQIIDGIVPGSFGSGRGSKGVVASSVSNEVKHRVVNAG
jgi:glycosyltransferase involved in cell wall biosynthesis